MSTYTVHEPPLRAGAAASAPERYVFVRDRFSFWAFLFGPLWMLRYRMWLVLVLYAIISVALFLVLAVAGAPGFVTGLVGFFVELLVGLESGSLRRFTLKRRGWKNVGFVTGEDREDAERRFFDAWMRSGSRTVAPVVSVPPLRPQPAHASDVIGLFPEPGASR